MIVRSDKPQFIAADKTARKAIENTGGATVYYKTTSDVSASSHDGTLTNGQEFEATASYYVLSGSQSRLAIRDLSDLADLDAKFEGDILKDSSLPSSVVSSSSAILSAMRRDQVMKVLGTGQGIVGYENVSSNTRRLYEALGNEIYLGIDFTAINAEMWTSYAMNNVRLYKPWVRQTREAGSLTTTGAWSGFNSQELAFGGKYKYSEEAGGKAKATFPIGTTRIGGAIVAAKNGGFAKVVIDGGAATPNLLRTAQQFVEDGRLPESALEEHGGTLKPTDRLYDHNPLAYSTSGAISYDVHVAFADGLDPTVEHYWEVLNTGYYNTHDSESEGKRLYLPAPTYGNPSIKSGGNGRLPTFTIANNGSGNNGLVFVGETEEYGEGTTVHIVNPGTPSHALEVSVEGKHVTITLATDSESKLKVTTANALIVAIEQNGLANSLIGVSNISGSTGAGIVAAQGTTKMSSGTPGWELLPFARLMVEQGTAYEYAHEYSPSADSSANWQFMGNIHGNERQTGWIVSANGQVRNPSTGTRFWTTGHVEIQRTCSLFHPDVGGGVENGTTPVATVKTLYAISSQGLTVTHHDEWLVEGDLRNSYSVMLPLSARIFDRGSDSLSQTDYELTKGDGVDYGANQADCAYAFSNSSEYAAGVQILDPATSVSGWAYSPGRPCTWSDRERYGAANPGIDPNIDGIIKFYAARSSNVNAPGAPMIPVQAGVNFKSQALYRWARFSSPSLTLARP